MEILTYVGFTIGSVSGLIAIINYLSNQTNIKSDSASQDMQNGRNKRVIIFLIISALMILVAVVCIIIDSRSKQSLDSMQNLNMKKVSIAPEVPMPTANPVSPETNQYVWLDELSPIMQRESNFPIGSWNDHNFSIDGNEYQHGIGACICGTEYEKSPFDLPSVDRIYKDYAQYNGQSVYLEYALRYKYRKITFIVGVDDSNPEHFNSDHDNTARIILYDVAHEKTLFDSLWVNYRYADYSASADLSNVDVLRIYYEAICLVIIDGSTWNHPNFEEFDTSKTLRFAIVDPKLYY